MVNDCTVDSGACATLMPSARCTGISIFLNDLSKNGVEYDVANGESIANLGERRCEAMPVGSMIPKRIVFQSRCTQTSIVDYGVIRYGPWLLSWQRGEKPLRPHHGQDGPTADTGVAIHPQDVGQASA